MALVANHAEKRAKKDMRRTINANAPPTQLDEFLTLGTRETDELAPKGPEQTSCLQTNRAGAINTNGLSTQFGSPCTDCPRLLVANGCIAGCNLAISAVCCFQCGKKQCMTLDQIWRRQYVADMGL